MHNQEVYMTALTSESYIPGVIALKKSLVNTKTKYPLVILIPANEANKFINILKKNNVLDKNCFYLIKPEIDEKYLSSLLTNKKWHQYWIKTFFKLAATSCTEFKKIVLLDSDLYIQNNIDDLFKAPHFSAVASRVNGISSGVMVIEPRLISYKKLLGCIESAITRRIKLGFDSGDQDVFDEYFPDWKNKKELALSRIYNCYIKDIGKVSKFYKVKPKDIRVIHFYGKKKPWNRSRMYNLCNYLKFKFSQADIYSKYISLCR